MLELQVSIVLQYLYEEMTYFMYALTLHPLNQLCILMAALYSRSLFSSATLNKYIDIFY